MPYECTFDEVELRKAYDELNEKPEWRLRDIEAFREICRNTPRLNSCLDDGFLIRFLRARKFEYDGSLELLLNYYRQRAQNPSMFTNFTPSSVKKILDSGIACILAKRDSIGRQLIVLRPGKWIPSECSFLEMVKCIALCMEQLIIDEHLQLHGFVYIVDSSDFGWQQLRAFYPADVRAAFRILQDAFPSRTKEIHFIHEPRAFGMAFSIMSPLFKEKIRQRIHFHGSSFESLHASISPDLLPDDPSFRGSGPALRNEDFINELMANEAEFERMAQFGMEPESDAQRSSPPRSAGENSETGSHAGSENFEDAVSQFEDGNDSNIVGDASAAGQDGSASNDAKPNSVVSDIQKRLNDYTSWIPSGSTSYRKFFSVLGARPNDANQDTVTTADKQEPSTSSDVTQAESGGAAAPESSNDPQTS